MAVLGLSESSSTGEWERLRGLQYSSLARVTVVRIVAHVVAALATIGIYYGAVHPVVLVGWFLAQTGPVKGFARAIFSGLPTVEVARVIRDHVLPRPALAGLYHLSAEPISKYDLLRLIGERYGKDIAIERDEGFTIDRSLDSSRFRDATGFTPPPWPNLVAAMASFR